MLVLLLLWPIAELFVIVKVAEVIGVLYTFLLLIAGVPVGIWAVRAEGAAVWHRMTEAIATGRPPARHVIDGGLVIAGGALLIVPGFITDLIGVALLAPPSRAAVRAVVARNFANRLILRSARFARRRQAPPHDVDSTAVDLDPPHLRT